MRAAGLVILLAGVGGTAPGRAQAADAATASAFVVPAPGAQPVIAAGLLFEATRNNDVEVFDASGSYVSRITGLADVTVLLPSLDDRSVYAALGASGRIAVIDISSLAVVAQYDASSLGHLVQLVQVDSRLYVRGYTSGGYDAELGVIDLSAATPTIRPLTGFGYVNELVVRNEDSDTDQLFIAQCENTCGWVTRGTYSLSSATITFSSPDAYVPNLNSLTLSADGQAIIVTTMDGTVQLRDPSDFSVQSSFTGAVGGLRPVVTANGIIQSLASEATIEERSLTGALTSRYSVPSGAGLFPIATPDDSTLLVAQESPNRVQDTITTVRGGLSTSPTPTTPGSAPTVAGMFVSAGPSRLLDTRRGLGANRPRSLGIIHLPVLGQGPVPATDVSAVVVTLTATAPAAPGYLTAYPDDTARPTASVVNFTKGQTVANLATVPVGADGDIAIYNGSAGSVDVIADIAGYYLGGSPADAGAFVGTTPTRVLDTRSRNYVESHTFRYVKLAGNSPIPASGFSAAVLNVTVTRATAAGYVTVYPDGSDQPTASNVNFVAGQTVANAVTVPPGYTGYIDLYNGAAGHIDLVVDLVGYFLPGNPTDAGAFVPVPPTRIMDTRHALGTARPGAGSAATLPIAGHVPVPRSQSAALINLTAATPAAPGYLTAYPDGQMRPGSSDLNFARGLTVATLANVPLGPDGAIDLYNGSAAPLDVVGDVAGYYLATAGP